MNNINIHKYEISILLLQYNSDFERIKCSLCSFINQENIKYEIVVADDGSIDNHKDEIIELFNKYDFKDFKLIMNSQNMGTVYNYYKGLDLCEGEYVKGISAGDYFYDNNTLRRWVDYLKRSNKMWSFGEAVYYDCNNHERISVEAHPQSIKPYIQHDDKLMRWQYLVFKDIVLGSTMLSTLSLQKNYCKKLLDCGVKYAEDNMWRLMMFDGVVPEYYKQPVIFYEYGGGISTSKNITWKNRLNEDKNKTDELMRERSEVDAFQKKILHEINPDRSIIKKIFSRGKIKFYLYKRLKKRMTLV